jgi:hypothetical protein
LDEAMPIPRLAGLAVSSLFAGTSGAAPAPADPGHWPAGSMPGALVAGEPGKAGLLPGPPGVPMEDALLDQAGAGAMTAEMVGGNHAVVRWQTSHDAVVEG